jgi:hypothetical protein
VFFLEEQKTTKHPKGKIKAETMLNVLKGTLTTLNQHGKLGVRSPREKEQATSQQQFQAIRIISI